MGQRFCKQCGEDISNRDRHNKFCNRSCAAKYNNSAGLTGRKGKPVSDEARWRMSEGMCETYRKQGKEAHSHPNTSDRKCKYEECGKTFAPDRPGRLYCSNRCRILGAGKSVRGKISFRTFQKMFRRAFPDWVCPFCEWSETFAIHHITPVRSGGTDDVDNLVALCPNHHSIADLGKIDEVVLRSHAIGRCYSKEELIERFYFGPATTLEVLKRPRERNGTRRKNGDVM